MVGHSRPVSVLHFRPKIKKSSTTSPPVAATAGSLIGGGDVGCGPQPRHRSSSINKLRFKHLRQTAADINIYIWFFYYYSPTPLFLLTRTIECLCTSFLFVYIALYIMIICCSGAHKYPTSTGGPDVQETTGENQHHAIILDFWEHYLFRVCRNVSLVLVEKFYQH